MLACFPALQFFKLLLALVWPVILLFFQVHMFEEKCFLYHLATTQLPSLWQAPLDASLLFHCWQPCLTWNAGRPPNSHGTRPSNPPGYRLLHIHAPRRTGCRRTRPSDRYRHIRHKDRHSTHQQLDGKASWFAWGGNVVTFWTLRRQMCPVLIAKTSRSYLNISSWHRSLTWVEPIFILPVLLLLCASFFPPRPCETVKINLRKLTIKNSLHICKRLVGHQMTNW